MKYKYNNHWLFGNMRTTEEEKQIQKEKERKVNDRLWKLENPCPYKVGDRITVKERPLGLNTHNNKEGYPCTRENPKTLGTGVIVEIFHEQYYGYSYNYWEYTVWFSKEKRLIKNYTL